MLERIKQISGLNWLNIILTIIIIEGLIIYFIGIATPPWSHAFQVSILEAIEIFRDGTVANITNPEPQLRSLAGLILFFIIGPGLLVLFGIGPFKKSEEKSSLGVLSAFIVGLVLTVTGILTMGAEALMTTIVFENVKASSNISIVEDEIRQDLTNLAVESYEYFVLPEKLGGGGGSFKGLNIDELPGYEKIETGTFLFGETKTDSLLQIIGEGVPENAEQSKQVRLVVTVNPYKSPFISWR